MAASHVLDPRVMRAFLLAVAVAIAPASAALAEGGVELRIEDCRTAPAHTQQLLGRIQPNWTAFLQLCPVRAPGGAIALSILSVRVDLIGGEGEGDPFPIPVPHALVLDAHNRPIGQLPCAIPAEHPFNTVVTFSDWRKDFPYRIDVQHLVGAVKGAYNERPLFWNVRLQRYE